MKEEPLRYLGGLAIAVALFFGLVWLYIVTFSSAFLESGYAAWAAKQEFISTCNLGKSMISGDSRAEAAIDPRKLDILTRNISFGASSPAQGYFFVQRAFQCEKPPSQVVFSFAMSDFSTVSPFIWENGARYGFMSFSDLNAISSTAHSLGDSSVDGVKSRLGFSGKLRNLAYSSYFPPLYFNALVTGQLFRRYEINRLGIYAARNALGHVPYFRHSEGPAVPVQVENAETFHVLPTQNAFFERTLSLLQKRNVKSVYIPTPVAQDIAIDISSIKQKQFEAYLLSLTHRYSDFHVVIPLVIVWPNDKFVDGVHLDASYVSFYTQRFRLCQDAALKSSAATVYCDFTWRAQPDLAER